MSTNEKIKQRLLLVGCADENDVHRRLAWLFDPMEYRQLRISSVQKVSGSVTTISTVVTQEEEPFCPIIERDERSQLVSQGVIVPDGLRLFAVGVVTSVWAKDEDHAARKVGMALANSEQEGFSRNLALSRDSTVSIEEISAPTAYAMPRDTRGEAKLMRVYRN